VATPPGRGGIGIVRIAGALAPEISRRLTGQLPPARHAQLSEFRDSAYNLIDRGIVIYYPAPNSYTGDDILELQAHGGPIVLDMLVEQALSAGARYARPGEFTERAFLNDKIDLLQAEAVADLIDSASRQAARSALRSLQGDFSARIKAIDEQLVRLRVYVEAAIDFPEEEIDFLAEGDVMQDFDRIHEELSDVIRTAHQGRLLREGMRVVITGRPNAGKSSLLNQMAKRDAAIVTDIPGTTRDILRENINIDGMPVHVVDTAGLRDSRDLIEEEGIRRAWREINVADCILLVVDDRVGVTQNDEEILQRFPNALPRAIVHNKIDLSTRPAGLGEGRWGPEIALSAKTGEGIADLCRYLKSLMGYHSAGEGGFSARRRHIDALQRASQCLNDARRQFQDHRGGELLAEDLRLVHDILGEITGKSTSDDLLGRIFADFCIGK